MPCKINDKHSYIKPYNYCFLMMQLVREADSAVQTRFDTNRAVQPQTNVRRLKLRTRKEEGWHYLCSKNEGADICTFVFTYAKQGFS